MKNILFSVPRKYRPQAVIFIAWLLTTGLAPAQAAQPPASTRPNIIYIMSDDHAAHAISAYGSRINQTPGIDRLAREGMRFDNVFATNSICTPSRATILTGKYSHINGTPVFNRFDGSQPTVAKYLQAAGYHTGMFGKWHLGSDPTGFDDWVILPGQGLYHNPAFLDRNGRRVINGYVTDIVTDLSIDFLKNRPKDKPFFLMSHHKAPHRSWEPDEKHRAQFAQRSIPEPATLNDSYAGRTDALRESRQTVFKDLTRRDLKLEPPDGLTPQQRTAWLGTKPDSVEIVVEGRKEVLTGEALNKYKYQRYMQDYLACVQSVDDNVARLMDWLDQNGLRENTLVIYTSDQGFFLGDHGLYDKRFMYEESIKMPFLVRWPKVIKPGSVQQAMGINPDFAPTFMDVAGLPVPADMQGRSLLPLMRGTPPADWRTSWYYRYYHDPGDHNTRAHYGVRTTTHKLMYFWKKDQWELYDLVKDPEELRNICGEPAQQPLVARLKAELARLKKEVRDEDQFADQQPPAGVDGQPVPPKPGASGAAAILTPKPPREPRINGPRVYGCRPGNPFLYRIPCTGERPIRFSAAGLPEGLRLDPATGIITGSLARPGEFPVTLKAANAAGAAERSFKIVCGDTLALTPPMGWNHWYAHYNRVTDKMMREAADAMVRSGMADAGYQYVNIDDCWMNSVDKPSDPLRYGPLRDAQGNILPNRHFPDMKALTDYIHAQGLKAGIYTSPGERTCAGFAGSYGHEAQDARQFADWGFDFLKHDWCSYSAVVLGDKSLPSLKKPYILMGEILRKLPRDVVFNLCQYGMGDVWEWGVEVGAQCWRTAGDLGFELNRVFEVALKNAEHRKWSRPGSWNDPDYLQIGYIGDARGMGDPKPGSLSPAEQYAFMSLWSLMAAPLVYSGDMSRLDELTLSVLCNPEVIDVDQDPLGESARVIRLSEETFLMVKGLEDGSQALGLCNKGGSPAAVTAKWAELGAAGRQRVRDLWRQKDLGSFEGQFQAEVPARGVVLVRIRPAA